MKKLFILMITILSIGSITAQTARLQVIHNSADPAANEVDVYINGTLTLDNFAFRTATPFIDVPANVTINIGIAPGNSTSADDTLKNIPVSFMPGQRYVAIANGVLDPSLFAANPDNQPIGFKIYAKDKIREQGQTPFLVDVIAFHGATDAPTVDIRARRSSNTALQYQTEQSLSSLTSDSEFQMESADFGGYRKLFDDLTYGEFSRYKKLLAIPYILDVTPGNENQTVVASFNADLTGLQGGAAVVFASGFLDPSANQNGASFGLFAALPNGTVVEFPQVTPTARLQVIHNAADPAANQVDVYVNGVLTLDDFAFRTATPFITVPAGVTLNIGVAPSTSVSADDTLKNFQVTLMANKTYVAVANGVLDPGSFAANPDGREIAFTLFAKDGIKENGSSSSKVDFVVLHGSSDAPTVDVIARNVATIVDDAAYGDFTNYITVPAASYILDITPGNDNNTIVASFEADLSGLGGGAAVVFASGFLNPAANQNGPAFGLFAALPNGAVVELPAVQPFARLQIIHNAADPLAGSVDIYVNDVLTLDDFAFRTATPYITVPAGVTLNVGVAPSTSTSVNDTIKNIPVVLQSGGTYVAIANGVVDPSGFASNPNGRDISFTLFAKDGARETSLYNNKVDVFAVHGSTDAPSVNIRAFFGLSLSNVSYGDVSGYVSLPALRNWVFIYTSNPFVFVGAYSADLRGLGGNSAVIFASGFLNPANNQNGEAFGVFAALANGTVVQLPKVLGKEADNLFNKLMNENGETLVVSEYSLDQNYPNPFNPSTKISYSVPVNAQVMLKVYDILGNEVATLVNESKPAGRYEVNFDASRLASGTYIYKIQAGEFVQTKKMILLK